MGVLASLYLTFAGFGQLAFAYAKHHRAAFGQPPSPDRARRLRIAGAVLLGLAPLPWIVESGPAIGLTTWLWYALPCVGVGLVVVMAFAPRLAARLTLVPAPKAKAKAA